MTVYRKTKYPKGAMLCQVDQPTFHYGYLDIVDESTGKQGRFCYHKDNLTTSSVLKITRLEDTWNYYGKKPKKKVLPAAFLQGF